MICMRGWVEIMQVMKVDDKYRILFDGEHLPKEIVQSELDDCLKKLKDAINTLKQFLSNTYDEYGVKNTIVSRILEDACFEYDEGRSWRLNAALFGIEEFQEYLKNTTDFVKSYADSETIVDYGFHEEWYQSGIYEKKLEDSNEREVVEEVFLHNDVFVYRKRTTEWELDGYSKHSKEIRYENLEINDDLKRVLTNSKHFMKNVG